MSEKGSPMSEVPFGYTVSAFIAKGHMTRCTCTGSDVVMTSQHPLWHLHDVTMATQYLTCPSGTSMKCWH